MIRKEEVSPHFHYQHDDKRPAAALKDMLLYTHRGSYAHAQIFTPVFLVHSMALMTGSLEIIVSQEGFGPCNTWPTGSMGVSGALILVTPVQGETYSLE